MSNMNIQKIGVIGGFVAPFFAFMCVLSAIASYPSFSWTNNALSDLGVVPGVTGALFMSGLCSGGILSFLFAALSLYRYIGQSVAGKVGAGFFAAATLTLICIGIFNESFHPSHYLFSVAFFVLAPLAFFIITAHFCLKGKRDLAVFSVAVGLTAAMPWMMQLTMHYVPDVAIPETISAVSVGVCVVALSWLMLRFKK
jgi:hypothetical membrane protein